jgi:co-chaperonin GroES (HSP10)
MAIEALGFRLIIRPDKVQDSEAEKTKKLAEKSGILLHEQTKENLENELTRAQASIDQGVVLSVGPTAFGGDIQKWCDVGDYVAYARHAGRWVKDPDTDENVLAINDEDVICRITKKAAKDD